MLDVLFLDDNEERTKRFKSRHPYTLTTETAEECIEKMQSRKSWDVVMLDHDLGGEVFVDSGREDCGMEVVRWMVANKPEIGEIIAHTCNEPAGKEMVAKLRDAGYTARWVPFPALPLG